MPKIEPEWMIHGEAQDTVSKLISMYPEKLGHIEPTSVGCACITNKEKPDSAEWDAKISGIPEPPSLFCTKQYIIWFYKNTWDGYNEAQRAIMLTSKLLRISEEGKGKILPEDLRDMRCLVKAFGVGYKENPNLPDISRDKVIF